MTSLEKKQKRVNFLKYLESKGIETISNQLQRNENEIRFILNLEEVRNKREDRLNILLNEPTYTEVNFLGKQFFYIEELEKGDDEIFFYCNDGKIYQMYHDQESGESVYIESIEGDIKDLIDTDILNADVVTIHKKEKYGTSTKTTYKFETTKGLVIINWIGTSTGRNSEDVTIRAFDSKDVWRDKRLEIMFKNK